jgi:hypothetical protein
MCIDMNNTYCPECGSDQWDGILCNFCGLPHEQDSPLLIDLYEDLEYMSLTY